MKDNETTNVDHKNTVTTNMIVTYPGKKGIEVVTKNNVVNIRDYLKQNGEMKIDLIKNSERDLRAYLAKYGDRDR